MSLINQMLRDLENRNTTNSSHSATQHNILVLPPRKSKLSFIFLSLIISAAVAGGSYWSYFHGKTLIEKPVVFFSDSIKKSPAPISPYEKVLDAPNALPEPEITQPVVTPIAQPVVSQLEAANQPNPTVPAVSLQAQAANTVQHNTPIPANSAETQSSAPQPQTAQATPERTVPENVNRPAKKTPGATKTPSSKTVTAKQQAELLFREAETKTEDYSAIMKLEQALMLDPRHLKARLLLAKVLLNRGQTHKTADFLDQSLVLFPDNLQFINTRAQLYLQQKNPRDAIKTLQQIAPIDNSNETYLSLLAAAYQQVNSFDNAAKIYQKLLTINPGKAENWLGLALSQEKLGNFKLAREAYQQALDKNSLKEPITLYLKQKLIELR